MKNLLIRIRKRNDLYYFKVANETNDSELNTILNAKIYTIGHSTRTINELINIIKKYKIKVLIDVRRYPKSRYNPQFNKEFLEKELPTNKIKYLWFGEELGGRLKKGLINSPNTGLKSLGFRAYADYMLTNEFQKKIIKIIDIAKKKITCYMCAEALPFRCHRYLISDYLKLKGFEVIHIYNEHKTQLHKFTKCANIIGDVIIYS